MLKLIKNEDAAKLKSHIDSMDDQEFKEGITYAVITLALINGAITIDALSNYFLIDSRSIFTVIYLSQEKNNWDKNEYTDCQSIITLYQTKIQSCLDELNNQQIIQWIDSKKSYFIDNQKTFGSLKNKIEKFNMPQNTPESNESKKRKGPGNGNEGLRAKRKKSSGNGHEFNQSSSSTNSNGSQNTKATLDNKNNGSKTKAKTNTSLLNKLSKKNNKQPVIIDISLTEVPKTPIQNTSAVMTNELKQKQSLTKSKESHPSLISQPQENLKQPVIMDVSSDNFSQPTILVPQTTENQSVLNHKSLMEKYAFTGSQKDSFAAISSKLDGNSSNTTINSPEAYSPMPVQQGQPNVQNINGGNKSVNSDNYLEEMKNCANVLVDFSSSKKQNKKNQQTEESQLPRYEN